jgi:HK97 gp10 family phage protein
MRVNIKVSGVNKTMRKFEEYTGVVSRKTAEAVEKTALDIERRAKTKAPVDTGRLKNSIHTEPRGEYSRWVGTNVEYAVFVEFGTRKMSARPYFYPSVQEVIPEFKKRLEKAVKE